MIVKRGPASDAEELGAERLRSGQTSGAYRDSGDFIERLPANAAIGREQEGKKGVGGLANYGNVKTRDCGSSTT
jgi:hypothetical protein